MDNLAIETPLNAQLHSIEGLSIKELPICAKVTVRGDMPALSAAIESVTGLPALMEANTCTTAAANTLYWLGPDERLIYSEDPTAETLVASLREQLPAGQSAVVDVSDYYTVIQISGVKARSVIASGTPFDVHPREFKPGHCAQTRFGNASILISCREGDTFDIQVRWSFAEYVWKYLCRVGGYV